MLSLVRDLLTQRRLLSGDLELLDAAPGVLAYARGDHAVAINTTDEERPAPVSGDVVLETKPGALRSGLLAPNAGAITMGLPRSQKG
jgi:hypothetical protein